MRKHYSKSEFSNLIVLLPPGGSSINGLHIFIQGLGFDLIQRCVYEASLKYVQDVNIHQEEKNRFE